MGDLLFVFDRTHAAIAAERTLLDGGFAVRVMPIPTAIIAGCGIGLRIDKARRAEAFALLQTQKITVEAYAIGDTYPIVQAKPVFSSALGLQPGDAVALIGCGGKTTLLHRLAAELRSEIILLATTTRILPPPATLIDQINPEQLTAGVNLLHGGFDGAKLMPPEPKRLAALRPVGGYTLLECDGSKGLPLKGWAVHEPVVPPWTAATVGVCTLWPTDEALSAEYVHRPELFCALTGAEMGKSITLTHVAAMISHENGLFSKTAGRRYLFINQVKTEEQELQVQNLISLLPQSFKSNLSDILFGSAQQGTVFSFYGEVGK